MPRLKLRRKTRANWLAENPVLADGEPGLATDTGVLKIGNGSRTYKRAKSINSIRPRYRFDPRYSGASNTEISAVATSQAADAAYNEQYIISANTLPANWPVEAWGKFTIASQIWSAKTSNTSFASTTTYRMMTDADEFFFLAYGGIFTADIFVDGRPWSGNPLLLGVSTGFSPFGFNKITFSSAKKNRLIEIRTVAGLSAVYVKKPYRIWKPVPDSNPKVAVVGDSYVAPTVMSDTVAGQISQGGYDFGVYQQMNVELGITSLVTDGMGGSGYIAGGGGNTPYNHATRVQWLKDVDPDVIVMHGGGANDLFTGNSVASIITAVTDRFRNLRDDHPDAKLVFMEGFSTPLFAPATYNPNYIAIRQGVQNNLNADGVDAYYIDVATSRPPLNGTGYVTAPDAIPGNTNIYIGSDQVHLTVSGNRYIRGFIANKLRRVLADDGLLVGQLI